MTDETTNPNDTDYETSYVEEGVADDQANDQVNDQAEDEEDDGEQPETDDDGSQDEEDAEFEEIERGDKKYRIPTALKDDLLRHDDYTRKTQALADKSREVEAQLAAFKGAEKELGEEAFELASLQRRMADLHSLTDAEWLQIRQMDAQNGTLNYDKLQREFQTLPRQMEETKKKIETKEATVLEQQQGILAKQFEEGQAVLSRDIPGWGPELGAKLTEFVKAEYGVTEEKHGAAFMDPALVKLAHAAYAAKIASQKAKTQARAQKADAVQPPQRVRSATAPRKSLDDRMSAEAWVAQRNKQVGRI